MSKQQDRPSNGIPDEPERGWYISRRGFLIGMAATGTAPALGIPLGLPPLRRAFRGDHDGTCPAPRRLVFQRGA